MDTKAATSLLSKLNNYNEHELRRLLVDQLTRQRVGLYWESDAIARDAALNMDVVLPRLVEKDSFSPSSAQNIGNLIIEGDNFDALRLLRTTHAGKIRVIYIDPPYNTGNKDWVYNDRFVGANDRWRHSQWLEFLYRRLTLAKDLLTPDGVIMVSINDENRARLELLMDEVLPGRRLGTIAWRTRQGSNADQQCFLSVDHEHVLIYGNPSFKFNGFKKSYEMYGNADNDPRGDWRVGDITLGFSYKERPNLYYPLTDPSTGISYPCSPDSVWRYATEAKLKAGQQLQAKSMEEFIRLGQIIFPKNPRVAIWKTMDELLFAIDKGEVPKGGKSLLLRRDLPNLEFWIGKSVGFGRPQFKRYKDDLRNQAQPLSSWVVPAFEDGQYEAETSLVSATNQEGAKQVAKIFGNRAFNYAKPISLMQGLLAQASGPDDTILDFFAGSGTTGHAVLNLNALDGGNRKFILCSSTEATTTDPDKNLCRDICAQRIKRVIKTDAAINATDKAGFAYLELDKFDPASVSFEATPDHAAALLSLRESGRIALHGNAGALQLIAKGAGFLVMLCPTLSGSAISKMVTLSKQHGNCRLVVYCTRPVAVVDLLSVQGVTGIAYSISEALSAGQNGNKAIVQPARAQASESISQEEQIE